MRPEAAKDEGRGEGAAASGGAAAESVSAASVRGLSKSFKGVRVLEDVSFDVAEGEALVLLGASGSGKTTILRIIAGLAEPDAGRVILHGRDVTELPARERGVGVIFQSYALFPHLTVEQNVAFGLERKKLGRREVSERVAEALELTQLTGFEKRRPHQMSGGQQQRVALARALVNRPQLLLLDEPLGALDLKLRKNMQIELKRIQAEVGITFLYVTHDQEEALTMSDRLAVMRAGRIEQLGPPAEMYEHPESAFVAGFLGTSNLLAARVTSRAGELAEVALDGGEVGMADQVTLLERVLLQVVQEVAAPLRIDGVLVAVVADHHGAAHLREHCIVQPLDLAARQRQQGLGERALRWLGAGRFDHSAEGVDLLDQRIAHLAGANRRGPAHDHRDARA